jgi:hypothetical protein
MSEDQGDATIAPAAEDDGWEWAIVEVYGHRRHAGRIREEERFGAKMLRIDVPIEGDPAKGFETRWYGGGSIFSLSLTDEASVMRVNRPYAPAGRILAPIDDEIDEDTP